MPGRLVLPVKPDPLIDMDSQGYRNRRAPKTFGAASQVECFYSSFRAWEFVISPRSGDTPPSPPTSWSGNESRRGKIGADQT